RKKMKNNLWKLMLVLVANFLLITACDEESLNNTETDSNAAVDNAITERVVGDVFSAVNSGMDVKKGVVSCPSATYDYETNLLTLDYGTGCVGADGVTRSGIIKATFTDYDGWLDGTTAVVSFEDYFVDGRELTGVVTITSHVIEQTVSFTIEATEMSLIFSDETSVTWSATNIMTLVKVEETGKFWKINGEAQGISRKGINFTRTAVDLLTDPTCKWFVGGTLTFTSENSTDVITFGECGSVTLKHNNFPAIPFDLNLI
ncbi:MAG: hypothetical protein U0W24_19670, partial [Bacteroidales bacterium]